MYLACIEEERRR
jgi:hypothetical protein